MKTKEFNLNKCRCKKEDGIIDESDYIYWEEDVKKFIKLLKEDFNDWEEAETIFMLIDNLAGDELI